MTELYIGLISGTSMDGIDAVLVDAAVHPPRLLTAHSKGLPRRLRRSLLELADPRWRGDIDELGRVDQQTGAAFAAAANELLQLSGHEGSEVRAIGSHGQTIRHRPDIDFPFTLQVGDPNVIAEQTGISVVADLRRRDMAAGGQGAPLVPAFHAAALRTDGEDRAVLNLGGIANLTILPAAPTAPVRGFDTGPANTLLDSWIGRQLGADRDNDGEWGRQGSAVDDLLDALMADDYFALDPPKSTGREYFNLAWLEQRLARFDSSAAPADVQSTLVELTARSVAEALLRTAPGTRRVIACGGGVHNGLLMERLRAHLGPIMLDNSKEHGVNPDWMEAIAFAWLARETLAGHTGSIATVTGASGPRLLGGIYQA